MEKKFMRKSNWRLYPLILLGFILFDSACAQNPPLKGKAYISEEKLAERTTVLLNNSRFLIPLQNLEQLKIASVHFSNQYAADFDSLLNKYDKITVINGGDYLGIKNTD